MSENRAVCGLCRISGARHKHVLTELFRPIDECNEHGWHGENDVTELCENCHSAVHQYMETHIEVPDIQIEAMEVMYERLERFFCGSGPRDQRRKRVGQE